MGFLPIIVAILGFILLWGIVNFYSIRQRRSEAKAAGRAVFAAAEQRNLLVKELASQRFRDDNLAQLLQYISKQLDDHQPDQISLKDKLKIEQKVSELIRDIPPMEGHAQHQSTYQDLRTADHTYKRAASVSRLRSAEYNELLSKNPSKLLARLSGFKPLPSQ